MTVLVLLVACEQPDSPAPIDTTIPEANSAVPKARTVTPEPRPATLSGEISYPSDYIPEDIRVCAENVTTEAAHCQTQIYEREGRRFYRLTVPAGRYRVYASTSDMPNYRAYYTEAVRCGLRIECESHAPIVVDVKAGDARDQIDPGDWYASN